MAIEIVDFPDFPITNGDFPVRYVNVYQAGYSPSIPLRLTAWNQALYEEVFLKCPKIPEDDKVPSWEKTHGKDWGFLFLTWGHYGAWF